MIQMQWGKQCFAGWRGFVGPSGWQWVMGIEMDGRLSHILAMQKLAGAMEPKSPPARQRSSWFKGQTSTLGESMKAENLILKLVKVYSWASFTFLLFLANNLIARLQILCNMSKLLQVLVLDFLLSCFLLKLMLSLKSTWSLPCWRRFGFHCTGQLLHCKDVAESPIHFNAHDSLPSTGPNKAKPRQPAEHCFPHCIWIIFLGWSTIFMKISGKS